MPKARMTSVSRAAAAWMVRVLCPTKLLRYIGPPFRFAVNFTPRLDKGEVLSGTPEVTVDTTDLRISDAMINVGDLVIRGDIVPAGYAVQFKVRGVLDSVPRCDFRIVATAKQWAEPTIPSLSTPPQSLIAYLRCGVE